MKFIRKFYSGYLSPERSLARKIKSIIGFTPARLILYKLAFYHKSMNNLEDGQSYNNERLEYLGDSLLSTIVAEYLFKKYPNKDEGFLTKMRSKIVKRNTLNNIAENMQLDVILTDFSQGRMSKSMMGNALEALVGAIYLESGYSYTRNYIINHVLRKYLDIHELEEQDDNFKSQLLEYGQKNGLKVEFRLVSKYKLNKRDRFKVSVHLNNQELAIAEDYNKKAAEQSASKMAVKMIDI